MACPKNIFTGKPIRKRQPKWKRQADYRRRKRGIYKVTPTTRRKMSRAQRKRRRYGIFAEILRYLSNGK